MHFIPISPCSRLSKATGLISVFQEKNTHFQNRRASWLEREEEASLAHLRERVTGLGISPGARPRLMQEGELSGFQLASGPSCQAPGHLRTVLAG